MEDKALENRLRRTAQRRGYSLTKSRVRDPLAIGYGWTIKDRNGHQIEAGLDLDEVPRILDQLAEGRRRLANA